MKLKTLLALFLALILLAAACGSDDDDGDSASGDGEASCDELPLENDGQLTVATGEAVFPPWMLNDDPSSGEGYESALVYALADELGLDTVEWTSTGFDEAVAPGEKNYDFNIQQYSITAEREEVVDFSDGYYIVDQAITAAPDNDIASAESVEDLQAFRLGAAIGTTSLNYIEDVIQPDSDAQVYDDNAAAKAAFDAGQVDGIVFDLPTAFYITAVEIPDSSIVGVLPPEGEAEELGMLFEKDSPLVACVNEALAALYDNGTIDSLEQEWLQDGGSVPTLTN